MFLNLLNYELKKPHFFIKKHVSGVTYRDEKLTDMLCKGDSKRILRNEKIYFSLSVTI